ncbi:hypothetical protein PIROE2DRAFT_64410 [Piromyces sp. E2]|nr:hypothetical protein PIROE2DRAFT_64410 [Piromyces sp. E2]|eukprot:OUM58433.1 hypothetical protein PIROE2DRAFT_64410 [Piromyces sp. E2]
MKLFSITTLLLINICSVFSNDVYRVKNVDSTLNVRNKANINGKVVASLKNKQYIFSDKVNNNWVHFYKGYASKDYLTKITTGGYAHSDYLIPVDGNNNQGGGNNQSKESVAKEVYNFFKAKGWTKNAICGMLGNMERESGLKPDTDEIGGGGGYGLLQWTPGSILKNWANSKGYNYRTTKTQCLRIQYDYDNGGQFLTSKECSLTFAKYIKSTKSPEYLAECFMHNYERPGVYALDERKSYARKWFNKL